MRPRTDPLLYDKNGNRDCVHRLLLPMFIQWLVKIHSSIHYITTTTITIIIINVIS